MKMLAVTAVCALSTIESLTVLFGAVYLITRMRGSLWWLILALLLTQASCTFTYKVINAILFDAGIATDFRGNE